MFDCGCFGSHGQFSGSPGNHKLLAYWFPGSPGNHKLLARWFQADILGDIETDMLSRGKFPERFEIKIPIVNSLEIKLAFNRLKDNPKN